MFIQITVNGVSRYTDHDERASADFIRSLAPHGCRGQVAWLPADRDAVLIEGEFYLEHGAVFEVAEGNAHA